MSLAPGRRLGPYEILSPVGAGGMGEVYRARDTRLDRTVAVKVLPERLSSNAEALQRFEREAKAVSSLNHANICTLYDVGRQDDVHFLIMEYLEGETLAHRLERGALPLAESLACAIQIADALHAAHRQGVVHRDLKPGNIIMTKAGAKLLDFGLAKSAEAASGPAAGMTAAPTATSPLTAQGAVMGTFQYMAPEQLEGSPADTRSDIFAFGLVLYEMLSGRRAFDGKTQASLIAAILKETPRPISTLQPVTPPALARLVEACLAKDPDDRRQSFRDIRRDLEWIASGGAAVEPAGGEITVVERKSGRAAMAGWIVAAVAVAAAAVAIAMMTTGQVPPEPARFFSSMTPPAGSTFSFSDGPMALSPDGSRIVFVALDGDGNGDIWLRRFDQPTPSRIEGTRDGRYPFWSPDGKSIAFFADSKLKRIEASGGVPDILCDAPGAVYSGASGGTWSKDGVLLFARDQGRSIVRVAESGGASSEVTRIDTSALESIHRAPHFLPDGKHFLYSVRKSGQKENAIYAGSLDSEKSRMLIEVKSNAIFVSPGHLLYWRDDALRVHPFDPVRLEFTGDPVALMPGTLFEPDSAMAYFSASATGVLALYSGRSATEKSRLVLRDRSGKETGTVGPAGNFYSPRLSKDGRRVATDNSGVENNGDIWVYDIDRPSAQRLALDPSDESEPVWSPGGDRIAFFSLARGNEDMHVVMTTGAAGEKAILATEKVETPTDWSSDGKFILFARQESTSDRNIDIWVLETSSGQSRPFLATPFIERNAQFSPDGRFVAYASDESGREEVYVRAFPDAGNRQQISTAGGNSPRLSARGNELFFISDESMLMAVPYRSAAGGVEFEPAVPLFKARLRIEGSDHYDVSADGKTILVNEAALDRSSQSMSLVLNWASSLARRGSE